jgi:ATP phosphoribosyltransferase regulatory subunit
MLSKYNYYTGIIFRAYTYGTGDTIANGGRYDNLVGQFGKNAPAIGLAIMVDQLLLALSRQKNRNRTKKKKIPLYYIRNICLRTLFYLPIISGARI